MNNKRAAGFQIALFIEKVIFQPFLTANCTSIYIKKNDTIQ
jgi:hypothetical protein